MQDKNQEPSPERTQHVDGNNSLDSSSSDTGSDHDISRRSFLKTSGAAALGLSFLPSTIVNGQPTSSGPRVAFIGTSGRGGADMRKIAAAGVNCPCFCDVDKNRQKPAGKRWPKANAYQDYRRMFDEMGSELDAAVVGTPDHHHFPAVALALQHGLHVYCEKPLTWSVWEARKLTELAREQQVATQMGNQLHDTRFWDMVVGWVRSGAIGEVQETHTWTHKENITNEIKNPKTSESVPDHIDWNLWLGPAKERPYTGAYHPGKWYPTLDFGTGAPGNMGCHLLDGMYMALEPGRPESVELLETTGRTDNTYPDQSVLKWEFDPEDYSSFSAYWYDGSTDNKPDKPEGLPQKKWNRANQGNLIVGTKGKIFCGYSLGRADSGQLIFTEDPVLLPPERAKEIGAPDPEYTPQPTEGTHHEEFVMAVKGDKPVDYPSSNFEYGGPLSETALLGSVAEKRGKVGKTLKFDAENLEITNDSKANSFLKREPRKGWKVL